MPASPFTFGIPSLDELVEIPGSKEIAKLAGTASTSLSLLGPDGSGKSVLALHLASRYRAWCCANLEASEVLPKIIYISSDLQHSSANKIWLNFALDKPWKRHIPFERMPEEIERRKSDRDCVVELRELQPGSDDYALSEVRFLLRDEQAGLQRTNIGFLDLAQNTAGDDWNYVNSLIVNLQSRPRPVHEGVQLCHLVIIDSVAGFETLMGALDAYGMEQSRRSRIAQTMRNAGRHANLVFVVEEPDEGKRLPEEYVTDVVVRLRTRQREGRPRRTVEIEKARARNHGVGEHVFEIRNRRGSSTGEWENPDYPETDNNYVHVLHSLSHRNLLVSTTPGIGKLEEKSSVKAFGLPFLDRLLLHAPSEEPEWGIRAGTAAALIGETGIGKGILGERFIAEGFRTLIREVLGMYCVLKPSGKPPTEEHQDIYCEVCTKLAASSAGADTGHFPINGAPTQWPFHQRISTLKEAWRAGETETRDYLVRRKSEARIQYKLGTLDERVAVLEARKLERDRNPEPDPQTDGDAPKTKSRAGTIAQRQDLSEAEADVTKTLIGLFRHPNLRYPAVLCTTGDRLARVLARHCVGYLAEEVDNSLKDRLPKQQEEAIGVLLSIIEEQLIVRRFDIDEITGAGLFDSIQRTIIQAQYLVHGPWFPPDQLTRSFRADRIRLIIDDIRVLANLCPAVHQDSAFLPFLVFYLEREGVTTLLVHTDSLRPGAKPTDAISQELMSLVRQQMLAWKVPFEGQSRNAITVVAASGKETNGLIREVEIQSLRLEQHKEWRDGLRDTRGNYYALPSIDVTPHLELYAGLESDQPRLVPLAVYLFGATDACRRYIDQEEVLYGKQFTPVPGIVREGVSGRVIWPIDAMQYYALRDLTHLPWDVKANHTIVDMVDGFWSLDYESGALASQRDYLTSRSRTEHDDPFHLFPGKPLSVRSKDGPPKDPGHWWQRRYYFTNSNYRSRIYNFDVHDTSTPKGMPDRVPLMWDFGFLMVPADPWSRTRKVEIPYYFGKPEPVTVGGVRDSLNGEPSESRRDFVDWRMFLGACREVAEHAKRQRGIDAVPFDFAATSIETLLSLVLEIWFSEIDKMADVSTDRGFKHLWQDWVKRVTDPRYRPLAPASSVAKRYSLANLMKCGTTSEDAPVSKSFQRFREDYQGTLQSSGKEEDRAGWSSAAPETLDRAQRNVLTEAANRIEDTARVRELLAKLPIPALCLYKVWLLLVDVIDFEDLLDPNSAFEIKQPKTPSPHAMAVRHYYRTACQEHNARGTQDGVPYEAWALPGLFSARGDSFVASPKASRSQLLASTAIDLLCSRRANHTRLQMGLGLPVRDIMRDSECKKLRTGVWSTNRTESNQDLGLMHQITYDELCKLGGAGPEEDPSEAGYEKNREDYASPRLKWLFRNGIPDYDRVSRAMQKWLVRILRWTVEYRSRHTLSWDGGFKAYDALEAGKFAPMFMYTSFDEFSQHVDLLIADLEAAERHLGD